VKNRISKMVPIMAKVERIILRFSEYKNSVKANNQKTIARGIKRFPIRKYTPSGIPTPLISATRKERLEGHHGSDIKIQVAPTKK
jgi:hypothetical protein